MKYPYLSELQTSRKMIDVFRGYNHNLRIGDGEFYDMTNLTSANYPTLSPRQARGVYAVPSVPQGMIAKDALYYVDGGDLIVNDKRISLGLTVEMDGNGKVIPKNLISMGAYIIIMPDKKWVNTNDDTHGDIEASVSTAGQSTAFTHCKLDGTVFSSNTATISDKEPTSPADLDYWIDTSTTPHTLKQYSATSAIWVAVATTYIKISSTGIGIPFHVGDGVTISGIVIEELADLNNTMIIQERGDDYIIVTGIIDEWKMQDQTITVKRQMPNMDFIIESENRLWGCRYGEDVNGNMVNEIYASKLGDFKNWNCFNGISTDSYAVSVGTDGPFTGAVNHGGYPLFFKESCMHKVYGKYPAQYSIDTTICRGVQNGCSRSLAIVNETLYYKARTAVCAYDGSLPVEISSALGEVVYSNAVAGYLGNKYYISMLDQDGKYNLFVYDTLKGMWHREDNTQVMQFCNSRGELYYIDCHDMQIKTVLGTGTRDTAPIKWEAVTGIIGTDSPDKKYISRLDVRMHIPLKSRVMFFIEYDSDGHWQYLFAMTGTNLKSFPVPIKPLRCDHLRLKIVGEGEAKIFSICQTTEQGSDL